MGLIVSILSMVQTSGFQLKAILFLRGLWAIFGVGWDEVPLESGEKQGMLPTSYDKHGLPEVKIVQKN